MDIFYYKSTYWYLFVHSLLVDLIVDKDDIWKLLLLKLQLGWWGKKDGNNWEKRAKKPVAFKWIERERLIYTRMYSSRVSYLQFEKRVKFWGNLPFLLNKRISDGFSKENKYKRDQTKWFFLICSIHIFR